MILYCRRCDLAFCEEHRDQHPDNDHELIDAKGLYPDAIFVCSVCVGIYAPPPLRR